MKGKAFLFIVISLLLTASIVALSSSSSFTIKGVFNIQEIIPYTSLAISTPGIKIEDKPRERGLLLRC